MVQLDLPTASFANVNLGIGMNLLTFDNAVLAIGVLAIVFAGLFAFLVLRKPAGTKRMQDISAAIREGAMAYLSRQYKTITIVAIPIVIVLAYFVNLPTAITFIIGAVSSALAGFIGMSSAIRSNVRDPAAAQRSLKEALTLAFRGGAVTGLAVVGLGVLGVALLYQFYNSVELIIGYAFGASLISLFARVGGGIYTKAADVGADLVGKVEKGIPEDDPRNPAVIADNVGDNVGDCAGMGADLFESYVVTAIAAMLLSATITNGIWMPLILYSAGIIGAVIGIFATRTRSENPMAAINKGMVIAGVSTAILFFAATMFLESLELFFAAFVGMVATVLINFVTEHYTSHLRSPVKKVAHAATTGAGTNVIAGLAVGLEITALPVLIVSAAIGISYLFAGVYGIALAAVGMLSLTAIVLAVDSYGPITDNAGGIADIAHLPKKVRSVTDILDAAGNTTKATTKGVAIASAALSALALFAAFADVSGIVTIDILDVRVLVGLLIGGAIPFLFSAFIMKAVGRAAVKMVDEVRRQFRTLKIMSGKQKPDYGKCVDIAAKSALHELIAPALLAVLAPIIVGFVLGPTALAGLLAGSIVSGLMLAITLANAGGAWDNAKKYIEKGAFGGKGSDAHKAAVIGDTVGDPAKDSAGPSINSLIKVMNTLAILMAPFLVAYALA